MASSMPPVSAPPSAGTAFGIGELHAALGRFRVLVALALGVSTLILARDLLDWLGVTTGTFPISPHPLAEWLAISLSLALAIAFAIAIAVLVVIGLVYGILGLVAWRRGTIALSASASEYGPAQLLAARRAREDHSTTLWLFVGYVAAAIAVSIAVFAVDAGMSVAGLGHLPSYVGSIATGLSVGAVLFVIYYFGSRQLVESIEAISAPQARQMLYRGREYLLAGAIVGLGTALTAISPFFDAFAVASLATILYGVYRLEEAYRRWLMGGHPAPQVPTGFRPVPT